MPLSQLPTSLKTVRIATLIACTLALCASGSARAGLVVAAQAVTSSAGATGASLDVTLTNTGSSAVEIGAFTFELTVGSADITFTGVTTATSVAYIFDGQGLIGPDIGIAVNGQDIMASDLYSVIGSGATVGAGATVGLGHLEFDVSSSASGVYPVLLASFPATSLSDFDGNPVTITTLTNGSISLQSVPEPSTMPLMAVGGGVLFLQRLRVGRRPVAGARGRRAATAR
jgi:PEP-CTERM motif